MNAQIRPKEKTKRKTTAVQSLCRPNELLIVELMRLIKELFSVVPASFFVIPVSPCHSRGGGNLSLVFY
jgi:hypothetical protein